MIKYQVRRFPSRITLDYVISEHLQELSDYNLVKLENSFGFESLIYAEIHENKSQWPSKCGQD